MPAGDFMPHLHPVLRRVYAGRGLTSGQELELGLDRLLPVSTLEGLEKAVAILMQHLERRSHILVVGDFDADGATSTALVLRSLRALGHENAGYLVPNRFRFGYGLTPEIVALAAEREPALIITVDNGISSHQGVAEAARRGIEVLITDHHLPPAELPAAAAIVNPNLPGSRFGSHALAGVGVAFYLMAALARARRGHAPPFNVAQLLDLVALGTIADLVPLDHNNRILIAQGMKRVRAGRCVPGITALLAHAERTQPRLVAQDFAFAVAPRLNAAGRLDDMSLGIECLLTDDAAEARRLAARLGELNQERREI
ncbi:MAG TPA: DHH family phosphoesterase [Steroidobacteraceae bacterium]|nr:DHH family phosphoesterase [Steroidobacteraceae bacterium]